MPANWTSWVAVLLRTESVHVMVPVLVPVVTLAYADVSLTTVTAPHETPDTPEGVNVGGVASQVVPEPVHVTTVTVLVLSTGGETESVDATRAGS